MKSLRSDRGNEALIQVLLRLIAVLCSNSNYGMIHSEVEDACLLVLEQNLIEEVVLCVNCVQLPETAISLSGVMLKSALYGN